MRLLAGCLLLAACSDDPTAPMSDAPRAASEGTSSPLGLVFGTPEVYDVEYLDLWAYSVAPSGPVVIARTTEGHSHVTPLFPGAEPYDGPPMGASEEFFVNFPGGGDPSILVLPDDSGANLLWHVMDTELAPQLDVLPADWDRDGARAGATLYVSVERFLVALDLATGTTEPLPLLDDPTVLWAATGYGLVIVQSADFFQVLDADGELGWVLPGKDRFMMVALDARTILYGDVYSHELVLLDLQPDGFTREVWRDPWPKMGRNLSLMQLLASPGGASLVSAQPDEGRAVVIPVTWAPPR